MKVRPRLFSVLLFSATAAAQSHWIATWAFSPAPQLADASQMQAAKLRFSNQTLREIVHVSAGGSSVRVRLSNIYGKQQVDIGAVHIALRSKDAGIAPQTDRAVTFSGRGAVAIPPDSVVLSDPIQLNVPASADLAISIFVPNEATGAGIHYSAQQTSYVGDGDLTASPSFSSEAVAITSWVFLGGVDVLEPAGAATIVAFGDSITDGARSTVNANNRWPDILASRLLARRSGPTLAVVDAGIGGNRILHDPASNIRFGVNALARFGRDALSQPGVRYVIVLEGINDLGHPGAGAPESETVSADDIIAGLKQMIERAHERGVKIYGGTLTPFGGTTIKGYYTPEKEAKRQAVNEWIRTSKAFDGVIDFEKAVRDPSEPGRMLPAYDGGDHLHPGDAGYKAMGDAIDLSLFK